ncbi:hypothetical protein, partial [Sphingomonas solaris]|uniref:hypothetical protein n=1 Tax=Alterirhizorhabdus solaris TaxID=2529389 RepID=UPI001939DCC2
MASLFYKRIDRAAGHPRRATRPGLWRRALQAGARGFNRGAPTCRASCRYRVRSAGSVGSEITRSI